MEIMCLVADRKELIAAIEETTGEKMKYQGPPTFAYKNGASSYTHIKAPDRRSLG